MLYNAGAELFWQETRWEKRIHGGRIRHIHVNIHETVHVIRWFCTLGSNTLLETSDEGQVVLVKTLREWLIQHAPNAQTIIGKSFSNRSSVVNEDTLFQVDIKVQNNSQANEFIGLISSLLKL